MGSHTNVQRHGRLARRAFADPFFDQHGYTRVPQLVQWMVTLRCPLSCPHCLAAGNGGAMEDMPLGQAAGLIEQVAALGVDQLLLTGGEPLVRPDLPDLIGILEANGVRWSLNTAATPSREVRRALESWPPCFVAVSLDGPAEVHDRFRGREGAFRDALDSLAYFSTIVPDDLAAGTTVTTRNFRHLGETFGIVLESGAASWGLHLVVPEGRAARRRDLFLSRSQLRGLLRLAAAKRDHFPVTMADEIGYCGLWDPLVRDEPFFCGAGRAQCVVLPDGEVVPCTTLDRSASAGNVARRPLAEIWDHGFAELRSWTPQGKCATCRYAFACQGGCWLQRRHGAECFRRVWHMPGVLKSAAAAVCIGLAAWSGLPAREAQARGGRPGRPFGPPAEVQQKIILQRFVVQWYAAQVGGRRAPSIDYIKRWLQRSLPDDPGAKYFLAFAEGERPDGIAERAKAIDAALTTEQRSLSFIALAWRDVTEWCLDGKAAAERSPAERQALRAILEKLGTTAEAWRQEIARDKLDPSLWPSSRRTYMSKAGPTTAQILERSLASRWGRLPPEHPSRTRGGRTPTILEVRLRGGRHGSFIALSFRVTGGEGVVCRRMGKEAPLDGTLLPFDLLVVPDRQGAAGPKLAVHSAGKDFAVVLPAGTELSYGDVLRLADEQHREELDALARKIETVHWRWRPGPRSEPLALPALRRLAAKLEAEAAVGKTPTDLRRVRWLLVNIYLF